MATQKKIDTVTTLADKISRAKAIVLTDYRGLKHKQFEEIRKAVKKLESDFVVAKNRLVLKALGDKGKTLEPHLHEPTAALFAYGDEVAPLKELLKFFKIAGFGKPKAGLLGTQLLTTDDVTRLASLPTRVVLLSSLASQLNAPIQGLHNALKWNLNKLVWVLKEVTNNGKTK